MRAGRDLPAGDEPRGGRRRPRRWPPRRAPGATRDPAAQRRPPRRAARPRPPDPDDDEVDKRPLDAGLIRRLMALHPALRAPSATCSVLLVVVRAVQLPALGWVVGAVLSGPIAHQDAAGTAAGRGRASWPWPSHRAGLPLSHAPGARAGRGAWCTTCATRSTSTCCACRSATSRRAPAGWGASSAAPSPTSTPSASACRTWSSWAWSSWAPWSAPPPS